MWISVANAGPPPQRDPHEGLVSVPNYRHRQWQSIADLTADERKLIFFRAMTDEEMRVQFENQRNTREYWLRRRLYDRRALQISCWHMNDFESAAMWAQYAANGLGVAIKSSYRRIVASLAASRHQLSAGMVEYIDWNTKRVDNSFVFPISKRMSFLHESELRIIYWDIPLTEKLNAICTPLCARMNEDVALKRPCSINWEDVEAEVERVTYSPGMYEAISLDALIDEIYVSPMAPDYYLDVVERVCRQFSLKKNIRRSDLSSSPIR